MPADPLIRAAELARAFLETAADRPVGVPVDREALRRTLGGPLPERGEDAAEVLERLARDADPGIVATAGARYFGFVVGGALPAAIGADWLTVQEDGTAWLGGTTWQGRAAMRISVSSHATTEDDAHRTVAAVLAAWRG